MIATNFARYSNLVVNKVRWHQLLNKPDFKLHKFEVIMSPISDEEINRVRGDNSYSFSTLKQWCNDFQSGRLALNGSFRAP